MKKNEFNKRVAEIIANVSELIKENPVEDLTEDCKNYGHDGGVFGYSSIMEYNFERNLREDYERKTTFTYDFSIAEWFVKLEGLEAIWSTFRNAATDWCNDIEYFAELIIVVNMKSWEMAARKHKNWSGLYAELYYGIEDLYFDWFDDKHPKHAEAMDYYFKYVD